MREAVELVAVLGEQLRDLCVRVLDDPVHLLVDQPLRLLRGLARAGEERPLPVARQQRERAELVAHAPAADHLAGDLGELLDVRLGAGGDLSVDDLLRDASAERDLDLRLELLARVGDSVVVGRRERDAERLAARDDRDLADRVGLRREHPDQGVAGLVVGGALAVRGAEDDPARRAEQDLLQRVGEVGHLHLVVFAPGGEQRRLVGEVGQVGADHPRRGRGQGGEVDVVAERHRPRVHLEDLQPAGPVGWLDGDAPVEPPGPQQRGVEDLGAVGRTDDDDRLGGLEAVHLGQDLIERLLALVVRAGDAGRPLPRAADRIELVDEDDRGRGLLGFGEQVAHARGADADDRLDELRGRDREERRVRLARDGARQQRLSGAGRAEQQHAVRYPRAEAHVLVRRLQEVDDLGQLGLRLVDPGDVVEAHLDRRRIDPPRLRAAEVAQAAEPARRRLRPPREEPEQPDQQQRRGEAEQELGQERGSRVRVLRVDLDALGLQLRGQRVVVPERRDLASRTASSASPSCRRPDRRPCA